MLFSVTSKCNPEHPGLKDSVLSQTLFLLGLMRLKQILTFVAKIDFLFARYNFCFLKTISSVSVIICNIIS